MTAEAQSGWVRRHRWRIARWSAAAGLLLAPYIAMQFTKEVNWGFGDFLIFGAMLTGFGLLFEVSLSWSNSFSYRAGMALALSTGFLLIWVVLAVGLIGHEGNTFNLLYVGVLSIGAFGAALARFEPEGMGRALFATAAAQVLAAGVALAVGAGLIHSATVLRLLAATAVFTSLWLLSAGLFRRAAREGVRL